ncbi:MAG TPA: EamA family transporter [Clostridiaceae bacterium]|nr:EamA family transporter [Clostridiaceae bacterium]
MDNKSGDNRTVPLIQFVTSMLIFGTIGIFRRYISLPSGFLIFARGLFGGLSVILYVKLKGGNVFRQIGRRPLIWLIMTGVLLGSEWIMLFEAYNLTTVAIASLCNYMQPIIVLLLSPLIFKERLTVKKLICAGVAAAGMVLVSGVTEGGVIEGNHIKGVLLGLGSALLYALFVIMNKKLANIDPYTKTAIQMLSVAGVMLPYFLLSGDLGKIDFNPITAILVLVIGTVHTGFAYVLYFKSMERLKAQTIAILSYIDPIAALLFSALILNESLSAAGLVGAVMILGAAIVSEFEKKKRTDS